MTFEEVKNLQISHIISNTSEFQSLTKQCLSIVPTATVKDDEIVMWINAGISDMVRQGIDVEHNISDGLIQGAIIMFVKSNFGMVDAKEKEIAKNTYTQLSGNLSLSKDYKLEVDIDA